MNRAQQREYIAGVRAEIARLADVIGVSDEALPGESRADAEGGEWLTVDLHEVNRQAEWRLTLMCHSDGDDWCVGDTPVGKEDELLYFIFYQITVDIAMLALPYEDRLGKREVWFVTQENFMARLHASWGLRAKNDHRRMLDGSFHHF